MPWKRGNPGDPCCVTPACLCADPAEHDLEDLSYTTPAGTGVATIKATIWDVPSTISYRINGSAGGGFLQVFDVDVTGLDSINGTHYRSIAGSGSCIDLDDGLYGSEGWFSGLIIDSYQATLYYRELHIPSCTLGSIYHSEVRNYAVVNASTFAINRQTLNDVSYKYLLQSARTGSVHLSPFTATMGQTLQIKCSEDFAAYEQPLMMATGATPFSSGGCTVPGLSEAHIQIGTVRMELVLL